MTPKEKAIELVDKFTIPYYEWDGDGYNINWDETFKNRKQCALIAVEEIYFGIFHYLKNTDELQNADREFVYWEQVKQEIEQL